MPPLRMVLWPYSTLIRKNWKASPLIPYKSSTYRNLDSSPHHSPRVSPIMSPLVPQTQRPGSPLPPPRHAQLSHHPHNNHLSQVLAASTASASTAAAKLSTSLSQNEAIRSGYSLISWGLFRRLLLVLL